MAENDTPGGGAEAGNPQSQGFPLTVVTQYVKDLSFENPGGPDTLMNLKELPHGTVRVDVRVQPRTPPEIEVVLFLAVEAKQNDKVTYVAECEYGGVFRLEVPDDPIQHLRLQPQSSHALQSCLVVLIP